MPNFTKWMLAGASALSILTAAAPAAAQDRPTDPSTIDILDVLVAKGVLTRDDANAVLGEARKKAKARANVVRVPYVPEALRAQIRDEIREEVVQTAKAEGWAQPGQIPSWLERLDFSGDIRVRGEALLYQGSNTPFVIDTNAVNNAGNFSELDVLPVRDTVHNRYRGRVRARLGVEAKINSFVEAGLRFATGDIRESSSTNETLTENFGRFTAGFDRAYIKLKPFGDGDALAGTGVTFGKFDNPFVSTELLFDRDLQFEGVAAKVAARLGGDRAPRLFVTAGAFPLEEYDFTARDKYLLAGQIGAGISPVKGFDLALTGAYYRYENVQGQFNTPGLRDNDYTAPRRVQFGNSLFNLRQDPAATNSVLLGLASKFSIAAVNAKATFDLNPSLFASLEFEGARNLDFDRADLTARNVPASSGDTAYHVLATIGHHDLWAPKAWMMSVGYRRLEADATFDLFTDSDFGLGGTDQKGFVVQGSYAPARNMAITGTWLSSRTIDLIDQFGNPALPIDIDTVQLDLSVKF